MTRRVPDEHIADVARAFRDYPDGARADLALAWPDLYYSVARLTSHWGGPPAARPSGPRGGESDE